MPKAWESLRLLKKLSVTPFPVKGTRAAMLSDPVVGVRAVYCAYDKGEFTGFDRTTLDVICKRPSEGFEPLREWSEGLLLVGILGGDVGMLDVESGKRLWTRPTRSGGAKPWRGRLVVARNEGYEVIEPLTGVLERTLSVPSGLGDATRLCGDLAVSATYKTDPVLVRALDLVEARVAWERPMLVEMEEQFGVGREQRTMSFAAGSLPNHLVVTRTRAGAVFGCSLNDGELLWHAPVHVPPVRPNVHDGRIYVFSPPRFTAIDEASGVVLYDVAHPELERALFPKTGTVYEDKIAFASESGHLAVFDLRDGRLVWSHIRKASLGGTAEADGRLLVTTDRGELLVFGD